MHAAEVTASTHRWSFFVFEGKIFKCKKRRLELLKQCTKKKKKKKLSRFIFTYDAVAIAVTK